MRMKNRILLAGIGLSMLLPVWVMATPTTVGLGGYWSGDENGNDGSGNSNNFTGYYGGGITFDTQDKVKGSASVSFNPDVNGNAAIYAPAQASGTLKAAWKMGFSTWIKFDSNTADYARINAQWGGDNGNLYQIYWNKAAKTFNLYMANINNVASGVGSQEVNLQTDTWYHLVVTADTETAAGSPNVQFYLTPYGASDVVSIGSGEWAPADGTRLINYTNDQPYIVGNAFNGTSWTFDGKMDEMRFYYANMLDIEEVRGLYYDVVPEPATMILLGLGVIGLAKRKFQRVAD